MKTTLVLICLLGWAPAGAVDKEPRGVNVVQDEITADSLLNAGDARFKGREYTEALTTYQAAVASARKEFNRSVEVEALSQVARAYLVQNQKDEGRPYLAEAAGRADDSDPMGWSRYLGVKGRFEWQDDDLKAARATFADMYEYCTSNALWGRAVDAAHMIAIVAESIDDQIEWARRGIEAAEAADEESWLGPLWNNLAVTYWESKQYDSALSCFEKARDYHWRFSDETAKLFADYHIGMTLRFLGRNDEARKWLRPVLAWAERLDNHGAIGQACEDLGEMAIAEGRKADGTKLLERARSEYKLAGYDQTWPEIWENINKRLQQVGK